MIRVLLILMLAGCASTKQPQPEQALEPVINGANICAMGFDCFVTFDTSGGVEWKPITTD